MNAEQLKNSILQRAIEGKLIEQREEEGTAAELLREIKAEKARLVKEGKLKKEKPLPEIKAEEIPFEIPESWEWVRLGEISTVISKGTTPKGGKTAYKKSGIGFLRAENICGFDALNLSNMMFIDEKTHKTALSRSILSENDILITIAGTLGRTGLVQRNHLPLNINQAIAFVRPTNSKAIDLHYILLALNAPTIQQLLLVQKKITAIPNLTLEIISMCCIPLPPLAEQKRIVVKFKELLPHVEQYGKAHDELTALNEKFPDAMKKSVLQYAMEGRLVEQRAEEGTAKELLKEIKAEKARLVKEGKLKKEKPLPEIKAEEIPFEIPESWEWVRLGEIGDWSAGATPSRQNPEYYNGHIPWLKTGDLNDTYIIGTSENITQLALDNASIRLNPVGSVLMAMYGATIGKLGILSIPATTNQACCACIPYNGIYNKYLFYFLMGERRNFRKLGAGGAQPNISRAKIVNYLFPLPPLAEQKRIVAKIEKLVVTLKKR